MDGERFDAITRAFGSGLTRRRFAAAIGSALAGVVESTGRVAMASCRQVDATCREAANCCSGLCSDKDARGRRTCICPAGTEACKGNCLDPATAYLSDPKNCGSCGVVCERTRCGMAVCNAGVCGIAPDPARVGKSCDDGDSCTTNDVCQADGSCAGTPVTCTVTEPRCQSATCNQATGKCETTNFDLGTSCANDTRCDGDEACDGKGVCQPGTPVSCAQFDTPCSPSVCDRETGQCIPAPSEDGTECAEDGIPDGVCCSGICSQCCSDASVCTNQSGETANVVMTCDDPVQVGSLNCTSVCDPSVIPSANPICTNPAVVAGGNPLKCRLPAGSSCSADTQCCGFCVNGTCQAGATDSPCVDNGDCAAGLICDGRNLCAVQLVIPLALGSACNPATEICTAGTTCGEIIFLPDEYHCCLPINAVCTADEDCCQNGGVQERCVLGYCQTRGQSGADCGKDFDCFGPLACINGSCGTRPGLGGTCDSDGDCLFDATSNSQPVCSGGTCQLVNGATCTSSEDCANGRCITCDYGKICGECCATSATGFDPVFCGDLESEKICCNHTCIHRNDDHHCGLCNLDCTCGGTDPYRYCTTFFRHDVPSWDWPVGCDGYYSGESGHCEDVNGNYCATTSCIGGGCSDCDCTQATQNLFCYACCKGQFPNLSLSTCGPDGETCLGGDDSTCCGENSTCDQDFNCSQGASICLSYGYVCVAN